MYSILMLLDLTVLHKGGLMSIFCVPCSEDQKKSSTCSERTENLEDLQDSVVEHPEANLPDLPVPLSEYASTSKTTDSSKSC